MKLGHTRAVALAGVAGTLVDVEAHIASGLPTIAVSGLPDKACGQAPDRIRSAASAAGVAIPTQRIVVNLSPASITKHGSLFDLPIAIAVLAAAGVVRSQVATDAVHLGELGLDGSIRGVRGVLPCVLAAARAGVEDVVVPLENVAEARLVDEIRVHAAASLEELLEWYAAEHRRGTPVPLASPPPPRPVTGARVVDMADVVGQPEARFAVELAACGGHHMLLSGPPGVGKTMLAERLVTVLPALSRSLALESHSIRSLSGLAAASSSLDCTPPYEAPHHSASVAAIVGGGSGAVLPGAISRAHGGVLFMDEAPEFRTSVLQTLRQPLESGTVTIARARESVTFPARFLLVLAANPCPCGKAWGKSSECTCSALELRRYQSRLSGPLMDRVDIRVTVPPVPRGAFVEASGEGSAAIGARVLQARGAQAERWRALPERLNGTVPGSVLRRPPFRLPSRVTATLDHGLDLGTLSLRGYDRVLRLAWSTADLSGHTTPTADDVGLALHLRSGGMAA
ncbi:MAG: YifB family Mg chelatase-like AAA ATPase [Actinobacteria bacterium]|nr:YifB family Mg chelatase-like AAA ATPase [Actinomycetota bacterium]